MSRPSRALDREEVVTQLQRYGRDLPRAFREHVIASNSSDVVAALISILEDESLAVGGSPGDGWAPVHAATLLGEMEATEAVEPMLRVLALTDWADVLRDRLLHALPQLGTAVLEPALRAYASSNVGSFRSAVASVLADLDVKDERIFQILIEELEGGNGIAPGYLAVYGDARAIEHLSRALDEYELDPEERLLANHAAVELKAAIEDLGGELTPSQATKYARAVAPADAFRTTMDSMLATSPARVPVRATAKPGRNDACWCGSHRKYKKCHLAEDEGYSPPS
jgi:HEAT repeat protein